MSDCDSGSILGARFERALVLAAQLHQQQTRKGTSIPYVSHLLAVASLVIENGGDEDCAIAALLHDAVEDQGGRATLERIRAEFGERVAELVEACTDAEVTPKPPWRARKEQYIAHLAEASDAARLISAADKLHNARAILADYRELGDALWERFAGGREGTLWYYQALVAAFVASGRNRVVDELERTVTELVQRTK
jgi:GTP pyrophosphokinase